MNRIKPAINVLQYTLLVAVFFQFSGLASADSIDDYVVSFETTDCDGQIGMGLLKITDINRINPYRCPDGKQLAQVFTRKTEGISAANIFIISQQEVKVIREEVKVWQAARRQQLLNTDRVIIN